MAGEWREEWRVPGEVQKNRILTTHLEREGWVRSVATEVLPQLDLSGWYAGSSDEDFRLVALGAFKIAEAFVAVAEAREAAALKRDEEG